MQMTPTPPPDPAPGAVPAAPPDLSNRGKAILPIALLVTLAFVTALLVYINSGLRRMLDAAQARQAAEVSHCKRYPPSKLALKYLEKLHGVEIGASTQNGFTLPRSINVDFADEEGGLWQDKACPPAVVNIVADGADLPFKDATLDYVLASHVIEHFFDPVKALREWYRVIRPGGVIFIIAPHHDRTFDRYREVTPVQELIDRSTGKLSITDYAKAVSQDAMTAIGMQGRGQFDRVYPHLLIGGPDKPLPGPGWAHYTEDDHHHWSVWRTADFVALVKRLGMSVAEVQDVDDKVGNGFTVVIRKPAAAR